MRAWIAAGIVVVALVGCRAGTTAAPQTPEELGRVVLTALGSGDWAAYERHTLLPADEAEVVARWSGGDPKSYDAAWFRAYQGLRAERQRVNFEAVRTRGRGAGFGWEQVTLARVDVENQTKGAATVSDLRLVLRFAGVDYRVKLDDCMKLPRGWVVLDGMRWEVDRPE